MPQWRYYGWPVGIGLGEEGDFQGDLILLGLGRPPKMECSAKTEMRAEKNGEWRTYVPLYFHGSTSRLRYEIKENLKP